MILALLTFLCVITMPIEPSDNDYPISIKVADYPEMQQDDFMFRIKFWRFNPKKYATKYIYNGRYLFSYWVTVKTTVSPYRRARDGISCRRL